MLASRVVMHIREVAGTQYNDSCMDLSVLEFIKSFSQSDDDLELKSFDDKEPLPLRPAFIGDRL